MGAGALVVLLAGVAFLAQSGKQPADQPPTEVSPTTTSSNTQAQSDQVQPKTKVGSDQASSALMDYSDEAVQQALVQGKKPVLFFYADWCPFCKQAEKEFLSKADQIPEDVVILKINYDTATELKDQYGITSQDTFVLLDPSGKEIKRWNGGGRGLAQLLKNVG